MATDLFISRVGNVSLDSFVSALPDLIGCGHWEQRQSSNYVEERYYRCVALGVEIIAAITDDVEFKDWPLWLHFEPHGVAVNDKKCLDGLAECVAKTLVLQSYEVIRPNEIGRIGGGAIRYQLNPDKGVKLRDRVKMMTI